MTAIAPAVPRERYRYMLTRTIDPLLKGNGVLLFVMLNPSTADQATDDPTIRRCVGFAKREGASLMQVVNLYAYRATDPRELSRAEWPVGTGNDDVLKIAFLQENARIICAWGAHPMAAKAYPRLRQILRLTRYPRLECLGRTRSGAPKHPLYVRGDAPLIPFEIR